MIYDLSSISKLKLPLSKFVQLLSYDFLPQRGGEIAEPALGFFFFSAILCAYFCVSVVKLIIILITTNLG